MAYTPLTTQVAGGTASAAGWANVVKANFEAMGPHLIARATSDESDAIGTLQNDDALFTPSIPANEVWQLFWHLVIVSGGNMIAAVTFPSGTFSGTISGVSNNYMMSGTSSPTATAIVDVNSATAGQIVPIHAVFSNGGTAGVVTLQWAKSGAGTTTRKANSTLWGVKLA